MKHIKKFESKLYDDEALSRTLNTVANFIWDKLGSFFGEKITYGTWEVWNAEYDDNGIMINREDLYVALNPKEFTMLDFYRGHNNPTLRAVYDEVTKENLVLRFVILLNTPRGFDFDIEELKRRGEFYLEIYSKTKDLEKHEIYFDGVDGNIASFNFKMKSYYNRRENLFKDINT